MITPFLSIFIFSKIEIELGYFMGCSRKGLRQKAWHKTWYFYRPRLVHAEYFAGTHLVKWDGRDDSGAKVASGIYLYGDSNWRVCGDPQKGVSEIRMTVLSSLHRRVLKIPYPSWTEVIDDILNFFRKNPRTYLSSSLHSCCKEERSPLCAFVKRAANSFGELTAAIEFGEFYQVVGLTTPCI